MIKLQDHWRASLDALGLDSTAAEPTYQGLMQRYRESGRFYHNLGHIEDLLELRDSFKAELNEPDLVAMAIWYHDAIYSTLRKGNGRMATKDLTLYFENDALAKIEGDYFAEDPVELVKEATKYKRQYPDEKRPDDDKKKQDQSG